MTAYSNVPIGKWIVWIVPIGSDNYSYLIADRRNAWIIDPTSTEPLLDVISKQQLSLKGILITHHHYDHTSGVAGLIRYTNCPVYGPAGSGVSSLTHPVGEGDQITIGDSTLHVIMTPGHTRSHVCYYCEEYLALWSGDTLFNAGCGRLFEGSASDMWDSFQKIMALPDETQIFCGHEYTIDNLRFAREVAPENREVEDRLRIERQTLCNGHPTVPSTLALEKRTNPFLRVKDVNEFAALRRRKDGF